MSKKFLPTFKLWLDWLSVQGYVNHSSVLNAADFGVPQNRERIFVVSMLDSRWFFFPESIQLTKSVEDYLEDTVDDRYYKNQEAVDSIIAKLKEKLDG